MTKSQLLKNANSKEIAGWIAFLQIEQDEEKRREAEKKEKKAAADQKVLQARLTQAGQLAAAKKNRHGTAKR